MIKKIEFDNIFIYGLYLYLLQIELSIDRVLHGGWKELLAFFEDKYNVEKVLKILLKGTSSKKVEPLYKPDFRSSVDQKKVRKILRHLFPSAFLYEDEIVYISGILIAFENYLNTHKPPENESLINLRMGIYDVRENIAMMVDKKLIKRSKLLDHFNHNVNINVQDLDSVLGTIWLNSTG